MGRFAEQQGHLTGPKPIAPPTGPGGRFCRGAPASTPRASPALLSQRGGGGPMVCHIQGHFGLTRLQPQLPLPPRCRRWMDGGHSSLGPGPPPPTTRHSVLTGSADDSQGGGGIGSHQHVNKTDLGLGTLQAVKRHREVQLPPKLTQPCRESCPPRSTSPPRAS